jgi:NADH dehydrogenase
MNQSKKVIIVGGGFAGIQTAQRLAKQTKESDLEIVLVSDRDHFEYYPALHTYLSVDGPVPYTSTSLVTIFGTTRVTVVIEKVTECDLSSKTIILESGKTMSADYLVLALGSQSTFFNIQGLPDMSFPFQNIENAKNLRTHMETMFEKHCNNNDVADCVVGLHFVVVGAGPNGVDLAGELATLTKYLCKKHALVESLVTIDLIEGASSILSMMTPQVQEIATKRLRKLGVNVLCNRQLLKQGSWTVALADMTLGAKTLIWTAGSTGNELVTRIPSIVLQKKNRITVNQNLEIDQYPDCFVAGDIADTQFSGLAQTAIHDGSYIAKVITNKLKGKTTDNYKPKSVAYNIGVGHGWSITQIGNTVISGKLSSLLRKIIDLKYFLSILPFSKVWLLNPFKK